MQTLPTVGISEPDCLIITSTSQQFAVIVNGKIVEHWGHGDDMGMMRQLGALPG